MANLPSKCTCISLGCVATFFSSSQCNLGGYYRQSSLGDGRCVPYTTTNENVPTSGCISLNDLGGSDLIQCGAMITYTPCVSCCLLLPPGRVNWSVHIVGGGGGGGGCDGGVAGGCGGAGAEFIAWGYFCSSYCKIARLLVGGGGNAGASGVSGAGGGAGGLSWAGAYTGGVGGNSGLSGSSGAGAGGGGSSVFSYFPNCSCTSCIFDIIVAAGGGGGAGAGYTGMADCDPNWMNPNGNWDLRGLTTCWPCAASCGWAGIGSNNVSACCFLSVCVVPYDGGGSGGGGAGGGVGGTSTPNGGGIGQFYCSKSCWHKCFNDRYGQGGLGGYTFYETSSSIVNYNYTGLYCHSGEYLPCLGASYGRGGLPQSNGYGGAGGFCWTTNILCTCLGYFSI